MTERKDILGDRMKAYENVETSQKFPPNSYLYIRLDGRSFSKFTKGLSRPYDERMSKLMQDTTEYLVKNFQCVLGYTQSDEISLVLKNSYETPCIFEGKKQKLISILASSASAFFNANLSEVIPEKDPLKTSIYPSFDCRIFSIPKNEVLNSFLWREYDAIKNSVSMAAHHYFSHKDLQKCNRDLMKDMLKTQKNIIWDDYPSFFKTGVYFKKEVYNKENQDGSLSVRSRIKRQDKVLTSFNTLEDRLNFIFSSETKND